MTGTNYKRQTPSAQPTALPASDWDFASIAKLAKALRSRGISASELLDRTIARMEALFDI